MSLKPCYELENLRRKYKVELWLEEEYMHEKERQWIPRGNDESHESHFDGEWNWRVYIYAIYKCVYI